MCTCMYTTAVVNLFVPYFLRTKKERHPHVAMALKPPLGFYFLPTDEELITDYLRPRALGHPLPPHGHVLEKDLYAQHSDPWSIFSDQDPWRHKAGSKESVIHVVTRLRMKGNKMVIRTAGCGTWNGKTKVTHIFDDRGEHIGSKRMLNFLPKKGGNIYLDAQWRMQEYRLEGVSLEGVKCKDYALCKITKDESECPKNFQEHHSPGPEGCSDPDMDVLSSIGQDCDEIRPMRKRMFMRPKNPPAKKMYSGPIEQLMTVPTNLEYGSVEEQVQGTSELTNQSSCNAEMCYGMEALQQQPTLCQLEVEHGAQQQYSAQVQVNLDGCVPEIFSACSNTSLESQQRQSPTDSEMSLTEQEAFFSDFDSAISHIFGDPVVSDIQVEHGQDQYTAAQVQANLNASSPQIPSAACTDTPLEDQQHTIYLSDSEMSLTGAHEFFSDVDCFTGDAIGENFGETVVPDLPFIIENQFVLPDEEFFPRLLQQPDLDDGMLLDELW